MAADDSELNPYRSPAPDVARRPDDQAPAGRTCCLRCRCEMEPGFIPVQLGRTVLTFRPPLGAEWVEGAPERSFLGGAKWRDKRVLAIITYRCTECGYLESYAPNRRPT